MNEHNLPIAIPRTAAGILAAFARLTGDGMHPLFRPSPQQVALAEYLARAVRAYHREEVLD